MNPVIATYVLATVFGDREGQSRFLEEEGRPCEAKKAFAKILAQTHNICQPPAASAAYHVLRPLFGKQILQGRCARGDTLHGDPLSNVYSPSKSFVDSERQVALKRLKILRAFANQKLCTSRAAKKTSFVWRDADGALFAETTKQTLGETMKYMQIAMADHLRSSSIDGIGDKSQNFCIKDFRFAQVFQPFNFARGERNCVNRGLDCYFKPLVRNATKPDCATETAIAAFETLLKQGYWGAFRYSYGALAARFMSPASALQSHLEDAKKRLHWPKESSVIGMHVRRGDACQCSLTECHIVDEGRVGTCFPLSKYVKAAERMKRKYGATHIYLATDSPETIEQTQAFPDFTWLIVPSKEMGRDALVDFQDTNFTVAEGGRMTEEAEKSILIEDRMELWARTNPDYLHRLSYGGLTDMLFLAHSDLLIASPSQFSEVALVTSLGIKGYQVPFELIWDPREPYEKLRPCFVLEGGGKISDALCSIPYSGTDESRALKLSPSQPLPPAFTDYFAHESFTEAGRDFWWVVNGILQPDVELEEGADADPEAEPGPPEAELAVIPDPSLSEDESFLGVSRDAVESNRTVMLAVMKAADLFSEKWKVPQSVQWWLRANIGNARNILD